MIGIKKAIVPIFLIVMIIASISLQVYVNHHKSNVDEQQLMQTNFVEDDSYVDYESFKQELAKLTAEEQKLLLDIKKHEALLASYNEAIKETSELPLIKNKIDENNQKLEKAMEKLQKNQTRQKELLNAIEMYEKNH